MTHLAFVDTETTGLLLHHDIWEIATILRSPDARDGEYRWLLPVDVSAADPIGLEISGFHKRHPQGDEYEGDEKTTPIAPAMAAVANVLANRHLIGAVVSFDEKRLERLALSVHVTPQWHYHLGDVENLAAGFLAREALRMMASTDPTEHEIGEDLRRVAEPPWDSEELSRAVGIDPDLFDRHTAMGDARWARAIWDAVYYRSPIW